MRAPEPLLRLARTPLPLRSAPKTRYRCLHASARHYEQSPPDPESPDSQAIARSTKLRKARKPYTNHLISEKDLTVKRGRRQRPDIQHSTDSLQPYTEEELKALKRKYSPEQMEAIKAGEASISVQEIIDQGALLQGAMTLDYLDDFSQHDPVIDKKLETPSIRDLKTGKIPDFRWKSNEELLEDLEDWLDQQPADGGDPANWHKFLNETKVYTSDAKDIEFRARNAEAPAIPPIDDPNIQYQVRAAASAGSFNDQMTNEFERLSKQTGMPIEEIRRFGIKFLVRRRVAHQTRLGKAISTSYLAIAGNGNGLLGVGEGKSQESADAIKRTITHAIRNVVPIPRYENRTIFGNVKAKSGATELELFARHPGFGNRCQSLIWEMCKMAGIKDISARVTRSRNPMNVVKATMWALLHQRDPEEIALARGRRMVDLRKVYYGGQNA